MSHSDTILAVTWKNHRRGVALQMLTLSGWVVFVIPN